MPSSDSTQTDLLIVGAGPAGLMLAAWACQYDIRFRIIDNKATRVGTGHADGLASRTLEIFDSFGLVHDILKDAYRINEICSWNPDPDRPDWIKRTQRAKGQPHGLSRYPQSILNQGSIEQILLDYVKAKVGVEVERNTSPQTLDVNEAACDDEDAYPIVLTLKTHDEAQGEHHTTVNAKYVVGCDGAHSWVRRQLGIAMEGDVTNRHFGVMDIVALTNFPDVRQSCVIHSNSGSVMTVPREGRLLRLYVQFAETKQGEPFDRKSVTSQAILEKARPMFEPYTLDFRICDWQSVYTIGQRVAKQFSYKNRVFLCGDAVHTHSPTMGQGMNVSMQDAYNLGWKLGSVIEGTAKREILSTYNEERRPVAQELIDLDRRMSDFYSQGPSENSSKYAAFRDSFSWFLSGVSVAYGASPLVAAIPDNTSENDGAVAHTARRNGANGAVHVNGNSNMIEGRPNLATGLSIGQRIAPCNVVCQAEANVVLLSDKLPSNGRWRVVVFAGDLTSSAQWDLVEELGCALDRICRTYTRSPKDLHSLVEVMLIHSGTHNAITLLDLHDIYHPDNGDEGWDYWKVYSDDAAALSVGERSTAYKQYGVDEKAGCVVVLRPDQHVAYVGPIADDEALNKLFAGILRPAGRVTNGTKPAAG
ncbi:hypothetical protein LTR27_011435 [Elasticomyces elasticus]|nr:hypothetical protein LTR27_011435 [Elasticomyces elasticus]